MLGTGGSSSLLFRLPWEFPVGGIVGGRSSVSFGKISNEVSMVGQRYGT